MRTCFLANALLLVLLVWTLPSFAQTDDKDEKINYSAFKLRNVGPAFTSGRIADIAIHPEDDNVWYVAVGSGGVWKTENAGVEMALFISRDAEYDSEDFPLDRMELLSLIGSIAPLAEFPEIAFEEGPEAINYKDLIASNAGARAHVLGTQIPLSNLTSDIDSLPIMYFKNGAQIGTGMSGDALGSQLEALEFLLRSLADVGEGVEAGQIIATGSLTMDLPLEAGTYRITYGELGELTYTLQE